MQASMGFDWGSVIGWGLTQLPGVTGVEGPTGDKFQREIYPSASAKASSTGIPVVTYWFDNTIAIAPDGSTQVIDNYAGQSVEAAIARMETIAASSGRQFYSYEYGNFRLIGPTGSSGYSPPGDYYTPGGSVTTVDSPGGIDTSQPPVQAGMGIGLPILIGVGVIAVVAASRKRR